MRKKIKDLTLEEIEKICEKQNMCSGCPFTVGSKEVYICLKKELILLNKEVEVEE